MGALLGLAKGIDALLGFIARVGSFCAVLLAMVIVYDVVTRYFGVPKPFGLNSTQIQESEYWLHTFLFATCIGYAYTRQSHVRIDLVRDAMPRRGKYLLELLGCVLFLFPFVFMCIYYSFNYAYASFLEDEVSKSVIGLTDIWILKFALPLMFGLLLLAGVSQLIKSIAGLVGALPDDMVKGALGGDL